MMFPQCYNSLVSLTINNVAYAVSMEPDCMSVAQPQPIIHTWETGRMEVLSVGRDQKGQYHMFQSRGCQVGAECCQPHIAVSQTCLGSRLRGNDED